MEYKLLLSLAVSLALTLLIELAFALLRRIRGRALAVVVLSNCLTNPPVVLLHALVKAHTSLPVLPVVIVLECAAILVEWRCYSAATDIPKPFLFSLQANALSYLLGCLIQLL